ncbi:MAG TPA: superoxide dismutase [Burkholderiales bacterium]|nr:superoxide dismutase [Burkholderiales bacterium]
MHHELPALPYDFDALEPHISATTLEYHYGKHHRAYVNKLNELVKGSEFESMSLAGIVQRAQGALFNYAAQAWNHAFYWQCLTPFGKARPAGPLAKAIDARFGSLQAFWVEFKASALAKFGSGWTWLVRTADGGLEIRNSDDADTPLRWNQTAILTCDVWEHAYYIDYRNERTRYLDGFAKLVNWEFAARNFES